MISSPLLTAVASSGVTDVAATITWTTEVAATSRVEYGIGGFGSFVTDGALVTSHSVPLTGLTPGAVYQYRVISTASGVTATSGAFSFSTSTTPAVLGPILYDKLSTTKVRVSFTTNVPTTAILDYGTTTGYGSQLTDPAPLKTLHRFSVTGLTAATLYHLRATATASGAAATLSSDHTLTTPATDATPPSAITDLAIIRTAQNGVRLRWTAKGDNAGVGRAASYVVKRSGATITSGNFAAATTVTQSLVPQMAGGLEELVVPGLSASTLQFFAVTATDAEGNTSAISNVPSTTTLAGRATMSTWGGDTRIQSPSGINVGCFFTGTSTGLTATVLTDSTASFPVDGRLIGKLICPDTTYVSNGQGIRMLWYRITGNTATTITVNSADGSMLALDPPISGPPAAAVGDTYMITGMFQLEKIGDQFWFIDPDGYAFFNRGAALTLDKYSGSFQSAHPHDAVYLKRASNVITANLTLEATTTALSSPDQAGDVINASGVTVHLVGDTMYIGDQRPFGETYFQMQAGNVGAGGVMQWYHSTAGGWSLIGGTGNPDQIIHYTQFNGAVTATASDKSFNTTGAFLPWKVGDTISVGGFPSGPNNGAWTIATITTTKITVVEAGIIDQVGSAVNMSCIANSKPWALDRTDVIGTPVGDSGLRVHWFPFSDYPSPATWAPRVLSVANGDGANTDGVSRYWVRGVVTTQFTTDPKVNACFENSDGRLLLALKYQGSSTTPGLDTFNKWHSYFMTSAGAYSSYGDYAAQALMPRHLPIYGGTLTTYYANAGTPDAPKNIYVNVPSAVPPVVSQPSPDIDVRHQNDMWEPSLYAGVTAVVNSWPFRPNPNNLFLITDEPDFLYGMSAAGGRTHMTYCILATNPWRPTTNAGTPAGDKRLFAKYAFRDFLRYRYKPVAEVLTAPSRSMTTPLYPYSGSANDSTAISNLNAAWGTSYTVWDTSSGSIPAGTNAWGTGSGFMDEDGRHVLQAGIYPPKATGGADSDVSFDNLASRVLRAAIYTDIRDFTALSADRYTYVVYDQIKARTPNLIANFLYAPSLEIATVLNREAHLQWNSVQRAQVYGTDPLFHEPYRVLEQYGLFGKPIFYETYNWVPQDGPNAYGGTVTAVTYNAGPNQTAVTWTGKPITIRNNVVLWIHFVQSDTYHVIVNFVGNTLYVAGNQTALVAVANTIEIPDMNSVNLGLPSVAKTRALVAADERDTIVLPIMGGQAPDGTYPCVGFEKWSEADNPQWYTSENGNWGLRTQKFNFYDAVEPVVAASRDANGVWRGGESSLTGAPYGDWMSTYSAMWAAAEDTLVLRTTVPVVPSFLSAASVSWARDVLNALQVATSGAPKASITLDSGTLPSGIALLDNADGSAVLGGMTSSVGVYPVTFRATNSRGTVTQSFTLTITGTDVTPPTVTIQTPTVAPSYTTGVSPIAVGGIASDNVGVTSVTWVNSLGGSGTATGTTTWSIPSVTLTLGVNTITVTAHDAAGNTSTDALSVTYATDTIAPTITITGPTSGSSITVSASTIALSGTADDNVGVTSVTWVNNRGGSGSATLS